MMGSTSDNPNSLKSLLAAGEITQQEYDDRVAAIKAKAKEKGKKKTGIIDHVKKMME